MAEPGKKFERLLELVAQLRAEAGCPWDREQTPRTIKRYLVEEVYEVVDAVEHDSADQVAEELGDLIFMAIFLAHLYAEQGSFEIDQVLRQVAEKMVRRHPHVFGDHEVDSARQVRLNWDQIKRREKPEKSLGAALSEIPRALPALMRAYRMLSRLGRTLSRPFREEIIRLQLQQSFSALLQEGNHETAPSLPANVGKLLFLLVAFSLTIQISAEDDLAHAIERFCQQVVRLEANLKKEGKDWQDLTETQERSLWDAL